MGGCRAAAGRLPQNKLGQPSVHDRGEGRQSSGWGDCTARTACWMAHTHSAHWGISPQVNSSQIQPENSSAMTCCMYRTGINKGAQAHRYDQAACTTMLQLMQNNKQPLQLINQSALCLCPALPHAQLQASHHGTMQACMVCPCWVCMHVAGYATHTCALAVKRRMEDTTCEEFAKANHRH